jgi:hypothetical protein
MERGYVGGAYTVIIEFSGNQIQDLHVLFEIINIDLI